MSNRPSPTRDERALAILLEDAGQVLSRAAALGVSEVEALAHLHAYALGRLAATLGPAAAGRLARLAAEQVDDLSPRDGDRRAAALALARAQPAGRA